MPQLSIITVIILSFVPYIGSISTNCLSGCQQCKQPKSLCLACRPQFQLSNSGDCVMPTIPNCIRYENRLICTQCRPSFRLINNRCLKMYDGCLQSSQLNLCSSCLQTSILDKTTSTCLANQLNCLQLGKNRKCIKCINSYRLQTSNNICVYTNPLCSKTDLNTGLCVSCIQNFTLVGHFCFNTLKLKNLTNCYLVGENDFLKTLDCKFCKQGYILINGTCNIKSTIIQTYRKENCTLSTHFLDSQDTCRPIPSQCRFFDYGQYRCSFCQKGRSSIDGICKKDIHKNCVKFSLKNPQLCETCKPKYYLNQDSQCISFPPFCEVTSKSKCLKCIETFLFTNSGLCIDPNCFQFNQFTGECNQCKNSYVKDIEGICQFVDPNCQLRNNSICVRCKANFQPNKLTGICQWVDPNCATFAQGICLQCKQKFYYNTNVQRCLKLPDNCFLADDRGDCKQCSFGYVLTTSKQCVRTNPIPNCKNSSFKSPDICAQCQLQYYVNLNGTCSLLPLFCIEFDAVKNQCKNCDLSRARFQDGMCKDKNCEYLDFDGTCLGCFAGYEFGSRGQCKTVQKDPNCKQFMHDQCRRCSDKHYFDKDWKCVPVSSLCREYDQNSGLCTSCYPGYMLSQQPQGQCIIGDPASSTKIQQQQTKLCKVQDQYGTCQQCIPTYELIKLPKTQQVTCSKILDSSLSNSCIEFKNKKCSKCITRRFLNKDGECEEIDHKCSKYDPATGECLVCYDGYELKMVEKLKNGERKEMCMVKVPLDLNCKTFDKVNATLCVECYAGYKYAEEKGKCQAYNDFCQTRAEDSRKCIACWMGYKLVDGQCIITSNSTTPINSLTPDSPLLIQGCKLSNPKNQSQCLQCQWGYLLLRPSCYKKDEHCHKFRNQSSLQCQQCYGGYSLLPNNLTACILSSLVDKNCLEYDQNITCLECKSGFKLSANEITGQLQCVSKKTDIMCVQWNDQEERCMKCLPNLIITETGKCDYPLYGFDQNCQVYRKNICDKCKDNFQMGPNFICIPNQ